MFIYICVRYTVYIYMRDCLVCVCLKEREWGLWSNRLLKHIHIVKISSCLTCPENLWSRAGGQARAQLMVVSVLKVLAAQTPVRMAHPPQPVVPRAAAAKRSGCCASLWQVTAGLPLPRPPLPLLSWLLLLCHAPGAAAVRLTSETSSVAGV